MKKHIDFVLAEKDYTVLNNKSAEYGVAVEELLRRFICSVNPIYLPYKEILLLAATLLAYAQQKGESQDVEETVDKMISLTLLMEEIKNEIKRKCCKKPQNKQGDVKQHIRLELSDEEYELLKRKCKIINLGFSAYFVNCIYEIPIISFYGKDDQITGWALYCEATNYPSETTLKVVKDELDRLRVYLNSLVEALKDRQQNN